MSCSGLSGGAQVQIALNPGLVSIEACVLAGGRSSRMEQDKTRMQLAGRSLLAWAVHWPFMAGLPIRVLRHDQHPGCGPLGGIETGISTSPCDRVLFLACDMPFVGRQWLQHLITASDLEKSSFTVLNARLGFPFILRRSVLPIVQELLRRGEYSLQLAARRFDAVHCAPPETECWRFSNLNTPGEFEAARSQAEGIAKHSISAGTSALSPPHVVSMVPPCI